MSTPDSPYRPGQQGPGRQGGYQQGGYQPPQDEQGQEQSRPQPSFQPRQPQPPQPEQAQPQQPPQQPQPQYDRPSYDRPSYDRPSYDRPSYDPPQYQQPGYQQPGYQQPGYEQTQFAQAPFQAPSPQAPSPQAPSQPGQNVYSQYPQGGGYPQPGAYQPADAYQPGGPQAGAYQQPGAYQAGGYQQPGAYQAGPYGQMPQGPYLQPGHAVPAGAAGYLLGGGVGFIEAIKLGFQNAFVYEGRASRSAYWWFALFSFIVTLVVEAIFVAAGSVAIGVLFALVALAMFIVGLPLVVRRLHDTDKSGWWVLISLIPFVGGIVLLVFVILEGTPGPNRFGG